MIVNQLCYGLLEYYYTRKQFDQQQPFFLGALSIEALTVPLLGMVEPLPFLRAI